MTRVLVTYCAINTAEWPAPNLKSIFQGQLFVRLCRIAKHVLCLHLESYPLDKGQTS